MLLLVVVFRGTARQLHPVNLDSDVTVLGVGTALFLWGTVGLRAMRPSSQTVLLGTPWWLGQHSYEVYLTHSFVTVLGAQLHRRSGQQERRPVWHVGIVLVSASWVVAARFLF